MAYVMCCNFNSCKNDNFYKKKCDIFLIFAQNKDYGYMYLLEPELRFKQVHTIYVQQM